MKADDTVMSETDTMVTRVNASHYLKKKDEFGHPLISVEELAIATRQAKISCEATRTEVVEWRLEPCPHRSHNAKYFKPKCACEKCWQSKLREWGNSIKSDIEL